jgi:hypothetical protein
MNGDFTPEGAAQSCVVSEAGRHLGAAVAFQEQIGRAAALYERDRIAYAID